MRLKALVLICSISLISTPALAQNSTIDLLQALDGNAQIYAIDGQYLGIISSQKYDGDSTCNRFGQYGSSFSSTSASNKFSTYGSAYSILGAYNPNATKPPVIIYQGRVVGVLTKNRRMSDGIDPDLIYGVLCSN
ncbi:MAG: hypothetical protein WBB28_10690 [Crinalium sp.]